VATDRDILEEFNQLVKVAAPLGGISVDRISFPQSRFTKPNDNKYLEVIFIPNNPPDTNWSNEQLFQGLFRLILHWPKDGSGPYTPMDNIRKIAAHFVKGAYYEKFSIYQEPKINSTLDEEHEVLYPATIFYRSFNKG